MIGEESDWKRIGRYDAVGRRALWVRFTWEDGTHVEPTVDENSPPEMFTKRLDQMCKAIELCAGREGDDAYVRYESDAPGFAALFDCLIRATACLDDFGDSFGDGDAIGEK